MSPPKLRTINARFERGHKVHATIDGHGVPGAHGASSRVTLCAKLFVREREITEDPVTCGVCQRKISAQMKRLSKLLSALESRELES